MDTLLRENNYIEDWAALVVAAFLLLGLGIMLGMYIEKSLKKLFVLKRQQTLPSSSSTLLVPNKSTANSEEERLLPPIDRDKVSGSNIRLTPPLLIYHRCQNTLL